uniref:Uncharacterized protein n=1 Tax=Anguilla anguilla TaxID=7936 RepID=A0A0E9QQD8_ANGAN
MGMLIKKNGYLTSV